MGKDKFEVSVDTETHVLYADVAVYNRPAWKGVSFYDTTTVINELNKQGYNLGEKSCIGRSGHVRSDAGSTEEFSKGRWVFKLTNGTRKTKSPTSELSEKPAVKKPVEKKPAVKKPAAKKPVEKKPAVKTPAPKKTTSDVLKEYTKKQNK